MITVRRAAGVAGATPSGHDQRMARWVHPIRHGWVVRDEVPGPDVDEFAEPDRVAAALAEPGTAEGTLLAVQHPHRTPAARAAGLDLAQALPAALTTLANLQRTTYRPVSDVLAPYRVHGPDGTADGVLCLVDAAAVDADGITRVRSTEHVYPDVVAERAKALAGLRVATSAAMLVPVAEQDRLTPLVRRVTGELGAPEVSLADSAGRSHELWLVGSGAVREELLRAAGEAPLLVADGNHRVAAAAASGRGRLLALVTAGPDLRIGPIHRALVGTGLTCPDLARAWRGLGLPVTELAGPAQPSPGVVVVCCRGQWLRVGLPPDQGIDHAVVESVLLRSALGLDPGSGRVRPVPGERWRELDAAADVDAVLLIAPIPLDDVLAVHAAGGRMPRKSTYFTPKPLSGLLLAQL